MRPASTSWFTSSSTGNTYDTSSTVASSLSSSSQSPGLPSKVGGGTDQDRPPSEDYFPSKLGHDRLRTKSGTSNSSSASPSTQVVGMAGPEIPIPLAVGNRGITGSSESSNDSFLSYPFQHPLTRDNTAASSTSPTPHRHSPFPTIPLLSGLSGGFGQQSTHQQQPPPPQPHQHKSQTSSRELAYIQFSIEDNARIDPYVSLVEGDATVLFVRTSSVCLSQLSYGSHADCF